MSTAPLPVPDEEIVENVLRTLMYQGSVLYPYRPALKNHQRWMFGTLFPRRFSEAQGGTYPYFMQVQFLVSGKSHSTLRANLRFLRLGCSYSSDAPRFCSPASDRIHGSSPREDLVACSLWPYELRLLDLVNNKCERFFKFDLLADVAEPAGQSSTADILSVRTAAEASACGQDLFKVTLWVQNETIPADLPDLGHQRALPSSLLSAHLLLVVEDAEFVSLIDPPTPFRQAADECRNQGAFPVLIGAADQRRVMLCSPIILYDYPQLAPESPCDLFDACEIEEMLALRLGTLTDWERQSVGQMSPSVLRVDLSDPSQLRCLHGSIRSFRPVHNGAPIFAAPPHAPAIRPGSRVRLRPTRRADAFDDLLTGRLARVVSLDRDFEGRLHVGIALEDDPGADLGADRQTGHRFFFFPEEIELLDEG